jgi:hypothetical protein
LRYSVRDVDAALPAGHAVKRLRRSSTPVPAPSADDFVAEGWLRLVGAGVWRPDGGKLTFGGPVVTARESGRL